MKNKSSLLWILKHAKKEALLLSVLGLTGMITSSAYVIPALLSRRVINAVTGGGSIAAAKADLFFSGGVLLLVILLQLALSMLSTHLSAMLSGRLEMKIRTEFFETLLHKKYAHISKFYSGEILNRFTSDIDVVVNGITTLIPQTLSIFAKLCAGLIVVASFSAKYALVSVLFGICILGFALLFRPFYKRIHKAAQEAAGISRSFTQECVENIVVVKTLSKRAGVLEKLNSHLQKLYRIKLRRSLVGNFASAGVSLIFTCLYYGTLFWGAFSILNDAMDYGTLMAFLQIVSQIQSPFLSASGLVTLLYSAMGSAERLMEPENFENEKTDSPIDTAVYKNTKAICAENLSFGYSDAPVISGTTFSLPKGSLVAITGSSGAGKSTLFRLLLGLFSPTGGKLYLETETGKVMIDETCRPLFSYVPQGNLLFSGTIRENIKFLNPTVSDAQMDEAARAACIYDFIKSLPKGFDTEIGERGGGLSEGQIQRISVARALCADAPILLLDECTSALDIETEEAMLRNIAKLNTKTVLFISHKNAAFSFCDVHLKMEDKKFCVAER